MPVRPLVLSALALLLGCSATPEPPEPSPLELVGLIRDDIALNRAHDVELAGDLAFVPGKGGTLAIIDISNPAEPRILSHLANFEDAETVLPIEDGLLLLGTRDFHVVDVADPTQPEVVATISDRPSIDKINGMVRRGNFVFAACKSGYIAVFDISSPREPQHVGSFAASAAGGQESPHDIALLGDERIVVVDTERVTEAALRVYKVFAGPDLLPFKQWTAEGALPSMGGGNPTEIGGANRVHVEGSIAYVGAFHPDRVAAVDLSDPAAPTLLSNMPVCDIDATGLTAAGQVVFAAGGECAEAIDASAPQNLLSIAQYRGGDLFPTRALRLDGEVRYDNGHDLVYRDGYLYVTAQNDNAFGILRVNDPHIRELASKTP